MIFEDTIRLGPEPLQVWNCLLDVNRLAACMPGVEEIVVVDERTFTGSIVAAVGPISGKFSFTAHILESRPPTELQATVVGTDSVTRSTLSAEMTMQLAALTSAESARTGTELAYRARVDVRGRLAILGDMVLRTTAVLLIEEFFKRLRQELAANPTRA
jgi:carbon monoxide dehydrogenase subunit G